MARRKVMRVEAAGASIPPLFENDRRKRTGSAVVAIRVAVPSRNLVTLDSDHAIWRSADPGAYAGAPNWPGAIVRLRPPSDVRDGLVEEVRAALAAAGVSRIKLEVRRGAVLPTEAVDKGTATRSSAREVVLRLVEEANSKDPAALLAVVEKTMAEEGL